MTNDSLTYKQRLGRIVYFFPFQLFVLHLKKNHLLLSFWLILFGFVTQNIATKYGVGHLFLYPEYLGKVNFWSFAIVGFALGGFVMAFNIYTYIIHAHRFPFLATLSKPFYKFSINNFIIPFAFIFVYCIYSYNFQKTEEFVSTSNIFMRLAGFILGFAVNILISLLYFFRTNKDIFKISGKSEEDFEKEIKKKQKSVRQKKDWTDKRENQKKWQVSTYLKSPFSINLAREGQHYDSKLLKQVFLQNHINASIFEILVVVSFLVIGFFRASDMFQIPASASALLLFTIYLMILSIFLSWMRGWTLTALIAIFLLANFFSGQKEIFGFENQAYGLNYNQEKVIYNQKQIDSLYENEKQIESDKNKTIEILENWKALNTDSLQKPKLIFVNCSGGGLRATLWTYATLNALNKESKGLFWDRNFMLTGSSGGMMGAAYWRESNKRNLKPDSCINYIARDILNPMLIDIATYDMFIRYQNIEYKGQEYTRDRAYSFEERFNKNTGGILDKAMSEYRTEEYSAEIPMMSFNPTIINDGRRLLISNFPSSFLNSRNNSYSQSSEPIIENVELSRLLPDANPDSLRFLSVMRMSATFPYILPQVSLPTEPSVQVMDAGIRDNFGFKTTFQYLDSFREWIEENTSGVIIVQIRDNIKKQDEDANQDNSILTRLTSPVGNVYGNFLQIHDYTHDQMLQYVADTYTVPVKEYLVELDSQNKNISLSWHLNSREKQEVLEQLNTEETKKQIQDIIKELTSR